MRRVILTAVLLLVGAALWAQTTLKSGMAALEKKYGVRFVYEASLPLNGRVETPNGTTLEECLKQLFAGSDIRYEVKGKYVVLRKVRKVTVSGHVTDASSGETLIGAGVFSGSIGTVTNSYGFYSLTVPEGDIDLTVSYIGFSQKQLRLRMEKDRTQDFALVPDARIQAAEVTGWKETGIGATGLGALEIPQSVIKRAPMILGEADVLKSLQLLPGVQTGSSGSSGLYVRGGGADENLLLLDGIPVYNGEHLLGLFSVFAPDAVKKVTLYKSSFPARYGGRTSSIVDVRMNDGNTEGIHGGITLGLLTEKAHVEGPIGKNTSFSLTGRVLHTGLVELIGRPLGLSANYFFYDVHAKVSHRLGDRDRLFVDFYRGTDSFRNDKHVYAYSHYYDNNYAAYDKYTDNRNRFRLRWGNTVAGLRWNHVFGGRLFSNTTLSWSSYESNLAALGDTDVDDDGRHSLSQSEFRSFATIGDATLRTDFEYTPSPSQTVRFGAGVTRHVFIPDGMSLSFRDEVEGEVVRDTLMRRSEGTYMPGWEASAYVEDEITLGSLSMNPGLHFDLFAASGKTYPSFQPRFSVRWAVTDDWTLKAGYSRMAQYVHRLPFARVSLPVDTWVPVTDKIPPQESDQWSTGVYYTGVPGWSMSMELYYKDLRNIVELRNNRLVFSSADQWEQTVATGIGRAYGAEWLVEKTTGKLTGWFSYTLSRSERRVPDGTVNDGKWFPFVNDRRHKISIYADYVLNERIDFSATWQFATGDRMTVPTHHSFSLGEDGLDKQLYVPSRNNWTVPPTHRLDVSVNFRKKLTRGERVWNVGVYNLYAAKNPDLMGSGENRYFYTSFDGERHMLHDEIPENVIYAIKYSVFSFLPSVSYTRTF